MRILILNWRCPRHPRAGGAELVTFEVAKRLVANGHSVEWFSAAYPGAAAEESIEGVHVVRRGRQWTVHLNAFLHYRRQIAQRFDVVVDEVNTMPFFTPLWARIPSVMFIPQLAREVWWYESRFPLNLIGYLAEPLYLRVYRRQAAITISRSTQDDLRRLGFSGDITIAPLGILDATTTRRKSPVPSFLYVGRLVPSKRVDQVIAAFATYRRSGEDGVLWLAGSGPDGYTAELRALARRLGVDGSVRLCGRVTTEEKVRLMAEAHCLLMASVREGWGLVVSEASACGTPSIVFDVPGLRDSVQSERTGLVVSPDPRSMAEAMSRLVGDHQLYRRLAATGREVAGNLSFEKTTVAFGQVLAEATA